MFESVCWVALLCKVIQLIGKEWIGTLELNKYVSLLNETLRTEGESLRKRVSGCNVGRVISFFHRSLIWVRGVGRGCFAMLMIAEAGFALSAGVVVGRFGARDSWSSEERRECKYEGLPMSPNEEEKGVEGAEVEVGGRS